MTGLEQRQWMSLYTNRINTSYKFVLKINDEGTPQKKKRKMKKKRRKRRGGRERRRGGGIRSRRGGGRRRRNVQHEDHNFHSNNMLGQIPPPYIGGLLNDAVSVQDYTAPKR
jgi:hypothetical protein